ncbi:MAG: anion permease, partial [Desulfovibrio sp.]|nr:anion permease [Desulfovibrio sp.]
ILTPYGTGPSPIYYGSGYVGRNAFWMLGAIFGIIYFAAYLLLGLPWMKTIF